VRTGVGRKCGNGEGVASPFQIGGVPSERERGRGGEVSCHGGEVGRSGEK
jgi:hypothetical protein